MTELSHIYKICDFKIFVEDQAPDHEIDGKESVVQIELMLCNANDDQTVQRHPLLLQFDDLEDAQRGFARIFHRLVRGRWDQIRHLLDVP